VGQHVEDVKFYDRWGRPADSWDFQRLHKAASSLVQGSYTVVDVTGQPMCGFVQANTLNVTLVQTEFISSKDVDAFRHHLSHSYKAQLCFVGPRKA
jgi:hypothetical protein